MTHDEIIAAIVKPIQWAPWQHGNAIVETAFGIYCIWDGHWRPPGQQGGTPSPDPKAAVEADYRARIATALDVEKIAALVEAAERFNTRAVMADNRALIRCIDKLRAALAAFKVTP